MTPADRRKTLSKRLLWALVTPMALLVVVGTVLALQVVRMANDARAVDHSDQVVAAANDALKNILDQETGLRGYLVTRDPVFLEPFEHARVSEALDSLADKVSDNPPQVRRVDEMRRRYLRWIASAEPAAHDLSKFEESRLLDSMFVRKKEMDAIRESLRAFIESEHVLRHERATASAKSYDSTRFSLFALVLLASAVLGVVSRRQLAAIAETYTVAMEKEFAAKRLMEDETWVRTGQALVATSFQGDRSVAELCERGLRALAEHVGAEVGAIFTSEAGRWTRCAAFGVDGAAESSFAKGEGLVGRAALQDEVLHVTDVPRGYFKIRSGTGETDAAEVVLAPAFTDGQGFAVVELGFLRKVDAKTLDLLDRVGDSVAVAVRSAEYKGRLRDLLEESQRQGEELQAQQEELQAQQEELRVANEELEEQSNALREANARSEERQEELVTVNSRLSEQQAALVAAQERVLVKAEEAERASRTKSEFLANMSHELRTPLNSSLILAKLLADNKSGNLTAEQVRFAETIYSAGNDLLTLINDILDLSKVEAGHLEVHPGEVSVERIVRTLERTFEPLAREKKLSFSVTRDASSPRVFQSDAQRIEQVLKNLVSNAVKFTDTGSVTVRVSGDEHSVRFSVRDTGIGIAPEQHELVFEAFRQADGTSARKHGGTGLGLSISRELSVLLGGSLELESSVGKGSTFTLSLPRVFPAEILPPSPRPPRSVAAVTGASSAVAGQSTTAPERTGTARAPIAAPAFEDDRAKWDPEKRTAVVVEDDVQFARILVEVAHERGFQCMVAHDADTGFALALEYRPAAVLLDIGLPDHSGLSVLDRLKRNPTTRHVPVHVISAVDRTHASLAMGAVGFAGKPVDRDALVEVFKKLEAHGQSRTRRLLIVEDDDVQRDSMKKLLAGPDVAIVAVSTVDSALAELGKTAFDCVVTDLTLPDGSGFDLLAQLAERDGEALPPIIVYTGRALGPEEERKLRRYSSSIIVKGARSPERLLDEVSLFLHQVESELPAERQRMLREARDREAIFEGRQILVVEDDVRNVFALTNVLESKGAKVVIARNGREALETLEKSPEVALVLMDIMMPEMDGLEATRAIRKNPAWAKLPILALTAKAMKDDQERCRQAGANDYITKPLDVEMLLSLLRVWLPK